MRNLLLSAFLLLTGMSFAQLEWAPVGAKWYTINYSYPDIIDFGIVSVEKDTIIQNITCKKLTTNNPNNYGCGNNYHTQFTYESGDTIYFYNYSLGNFSMLYDFGAQQGDTWNIVVEWQSQLDTLNIVVDSVRQISVNGYSLKKIFTTQTNPLSAKYFFEGPVIEKIGSSCLLPDIKYCDPPSGIVSCFISSDLNYHSGDAAVPCDYSNLELFENKLEKSSLFPNPFISEFLLPLNVSANNIQITDLNGKKINFEKIENTIYPLNCSSGIYFLSFEVDNKTYNYKIVKS